MIPLVVASERGVAQTCGVAMLRRGSRTTIWHVFVEEKDLESSGMEGDTPVSVRMFVSVAS